MVYVDDMKAPYKGMIMCHMIADTKKELLEMCDKIGVNRKWIQHEGTYQEHFDVCQAKRKLAVKNGAFEVTRRDLVKRIMEKRVFNGMLIMDRGLPKKDIPDENKYRLLKR